MYKTHATHFASQKFEDACVLTDALKMCVCWPMHAVNLLTSNKVASY